MKWHFDGHGINDEGGTRICKVQLENYLNVNGKPVRNKEFDRISELIAKAPEMLKALESMTGLFAQFCRGANEWVQYRNAVALIAEIEEVEG